MKRMWAPWRMGYILGNKVEGCVFCKKLQESDDGANYVLYRGGTAALILNLYPYTNGHLMVVPYSHCGDLAELDDETLGEMMRLTKLCIRLLRKAMSPHGFNVGMNLGQAAGAGIREHVHIHVVPRWDNDTNFMPVLGDVRVIPESLDDTYKKLATALRQVDEDAETVE